MLVATFTGGFSGNGSYRLRLEIWEDAGSVNVAANTSVVYYQLWVDKLAGSGFWTGSASAGSSCDGGMAGASGLGGNWTPYDFRNYSSLLIASGNKTITHNADGTGYISGGFYSNDSSNFGSAGAGYGLTLTTIPRATTATFPSGTVVAGSSITGTLPRASSSFTHDISYSIGSLSGQTTGLSAFTAVATTFDLVPPLALLKQMAGEAAKSLVVTVVTKNGATVIGTANTVLSLLPPSSTPYILPNPSALVIRCGPGGAVDPNGEHIKITPNFSVGSILTGSQQNTLTYKIEAKEKGAGSYPATPLVNATVPSNGLTFTTPLVYADYNPSVGGTQPFDDNTSYDIRITITDVLGSVVVNQLVLYPTDAIADFYRPTKGMSIGRKYDAGLGGSLQLVDEGYQRDGKAIIDEDSLSDELESLLSEDRFIPIVPSSIAYTGTSAVINADGSVSAVGCTLLQLRGLFDTNYSWYRIYVSSRSIYLAAATSYFFLRLMNGTTASSSGVYYTRGAYNNSGPAVSPFDVSAGTAFYALSMTTTATAVWTCVYDIYSPAVATDNTIGKFEMVQAINAAWNTGMLLYNAPEAFNGVQFHPNSGAIPIHVRVFAQEKKVYV